MTETPLSQQDIVQTDTDAESRMFETVTQETTSDVSDLEDGIRSNKINILSEDDSFKKIQGLILQDILKDLKRDNALQGKSVADVIDTIQRNIAREQHPDILRAKQEAFAAMTAGLNKVSKQEFSTLDLKHQFRMMMLYHTFLSKPPIFSKGGIGERLMSTFASKQSNTRVQRLEYRQAYLVEKVNDHFADKQPNGIKNYLFKLLKDNPSISEQDIDFAIQELVALQKYIESKNPVESGLHAYGYALVFIIGLGLGSLGTLGIQSLFDKDIVSQTTEIKQGPLSVNIEQIITEGMLSTPLSTQTVPYHTSGVIDKQTNILGFEDVFGKYDNVPYTLDSEIKIDLGLGHGDIALASIVAMETKEHVIITMEDILTGLHITDSSNGPITIKDEKGYVFNMNTTEQQQLNNLLLTQTSRDSIASATFKAQRDNPAVLASLQKNAAATLFAKGGERKTFFENANMMQAKSMSMVFKLANGNYFQVVGKNGVIYGRELSGALPTMPAEWEKTTQSTISAGNTFDQRLAQWVYPTKG